MGFSLYKKIRWHLNERVLRNLQLLRRAKGWLTVLDAFGAPGDALLAATVCRILKDRYPGLRINLCTQWPDLVRHDPCLAAVNAPETYFTLRFWYVETVGRKERERNVLRETLHKVGISDYRYRARVYLTEAERHEAAARMPDSALPRLAFSTLSKEHVKNWPEERWKELLERLRGRWSLVHLGDDREPEFEGVIRFAGTLSMRKSMAVLSHCDVYAGPDSFLMHAANGLDVPSVILFGGSRTPACLGYPENTNIYVPMPCGPCWLHDSQGDVCEHYLACMEPITVEEVFGALSQRLSLA